MISAVTAVFGLVPGYSALLGGMISWVANAYFARKVLIDGNKGSEQSLLLRWYVAEFIKIAMTAVLLAAVYTLLEEVNALALIGGFFVAYVGGALTLAASKLPSDKADEQSS